MNLSLLLTLSLLLSAPETAAAVPDVERAPVARLRLARDRVASEDLAGARALLEPLVARYPGFGLAQLEWALLLEKLGAPLQEQGPALDAARRLEPKNPRVWVASCRLFDQAGDVGAAIDACLRARQMRPEQIDLPRLGVLLSTAGRHPEAIAVLREALAHRPGDRAARAHLAESCERAGDVACAEASLTELFRQDPSSAVHARRLARFYERHGQPERAAGVLKQSGEAPRRALRPLPPSSK